MHMLIIMRLKFRLIIRQKDDLRHTYWCRSDCSREGIFLTIRAHLNSGDEVKILLQAAVSRAKRAGISRQVLSSYMDDCYREVNCSSSITLLPDLDDVLDLSASIEGESSPINCFSWDRGMEQHPPPTENPPQFEEYWRILHQQSWQLGQS